MLIRVLPSNYITTSPISGWVHILQLSVSTADMLSLAKREASELLSKALGESGLPWPWWWVDSTSGLDFLNKIENH